MPWHGRESRPNRVDGSGRLGLRLLALCIGVTLVVTSASCGSRPRQAERAVTRGISGADGPSRDGDSLASEVRARKRDILVALPLARRVERIIKGRPGHPPFTFEGFFAGQELVCVKAIPPPDGDTTNVVTYVYDRGRLLGLDYELRWGGRGKAAGNVTIHGLFGPDGSVLECETIVNGKARTLPSAEAKYMMRVMRPPAQEAYEEVMTHSGG